MRYRPGNYQYTEAQMRGRIRKLWPKLFFRRGVDILVTHAPAYQLNDGRDLAHQGFRCFVKFMEKYKPRFFCTDMYTCPMGETINATTSIRTHIINAYEKCVFDYEKEENPIVR